MTLGFLSLSVAAAALVACATSALAALVFRATADRLVRLSPRAQARLLLALIWLPVLVTGVVMLAALSPSFGWVADHCALGDHVHGHPHICLRHTSGLPAPPITALAIAFAARLLWALGTVGWSVLSAQRLGQRLSSAASRSDRGLRVLPIDEPRAFVVGALRPQIYVTRGMLGARAREHLPVILAHERAHLRRGDPLRRALASIALAFHLPRPARRLDEALARAHELAADEAAAKAVGSREQVAQAIVELARHRSSFARAVHAFGETAIEARVQSLLDETSRAESPRARLLGLLGIGLVALVATTAGAVHHGIEILLGIIGG